MTWAQVAKLLANHGEAVITLAVGALLGILGNWYFFRRGEKAKLLGWERVSKNRIISASEDQRKHLVVAYKGQEVKNPYILVLRVVNIGKVEIREEDFTEPISVDFGDVQLVALEVTGASEKVTGAFTVDTSKPNLVRYTPQLLNRDEWVELQFVTDGDPARFVVDTRFAGQSAPIKNMDERRERASMRTYGLPITRRVLALIVGAIGVVLALGSLLQLGQTFGYVTAVTTTVMVCTVLVALFVRLRRW